MNVIEKLKRLWWIILSFIPFINGFGFIYIGFKNNNKNWVLEGIIYEIPWIFCIIYSQNQNIFEGLFIIAIVVTFISIIRSIWVAIKLFDVYDNEDKYTIRQTVVNNTKVEKGNITQPQKMGCCLCVFLIFIVFAIMAML